jgi:hypothetical protein
MRGKGKKEAPNGKMLSKDCFLGEVRRGGGEQVRRYLMFNYLIFN